MSFLSLNKWNAVPISGMVPLIPTAVISFMNFLEACGGISASNRANLFIFRKVLIPNMIENKFIFKASGIFSFM